MRKVSLRAGIAVLAVVGLVAAIPVVAVYDYVEHDPRFCTSCHLMNDAFGRWQKSEHRKIECHACHESSLSDNLSRLYFSIVDPKSEVETHAGVDRAVCLECHESRGGERWQRVLSTAGHKVHAERLAAQCIDCHGESLHKLTPPADVCVRCHEDVKLHETKMTGLECLDCHDYLAGDGFSDATLLPSAADCRRCHVEAEGGRRGPQIESPLARRISPSATHSRLDCRVCHHPHADRVEGRRPGTECARCHRGTFGEAAERAPEGHATCRGCHAPHAAAGDAKERCLACHETKRSAVSPEKHAGCTTCHAPHGFTADPRDCGVCHPGVAQRLFEDAPRSHSTCVGCHDPHVTRPGGARCGKCHERELGALQSARIDAHRSCLACHESHGRKPVFGDTCVRCHERERDLALASPYPEHRDCRSCHRDPHGRPATVAATCSPCHAAETDRTLEPNRPDGHRPCDACHAVHGTRSARPSATDRCADCHADRTEMLEAWSQPEHRACASCHDIHGEKTPGACAGCHAVQSRSLRDTSHRACIDCHDVHTGSPIEGRTWRAACERCHPEIALEGKSRGPTHASCATCHPPHAPDKPACETCHGAIRGELLHQVADHQNCRGCHAAHGGQFPDRSTCLACHTDARDHFPGSPRCDGCHPFASPVTRR